MASSPQGQAQGQTQPPLLELEHVTKRFGGLPAVEDLSFSVRQGEVLGMIGPNGAGKSTAISLIGGALAPTAGTVRFQGRDITGLAPHRRAQLGIARTFQIPPPFAPPDLRENVIVGALLPRPERSRAAPPPRAHALLQPRGLAP